MAGVNEELLRLAQYQVWKQAGEKTAAVPAGDPAAAGGAPAPGAAPGGAPAPAGGPPMGAPPMGAPPMDPAAMGGMAGMGAPGMPPGMPGQMPGMPGQQQPVQQKIKPEQWMQMLDFRLYNLQQQLTAICNSLGVTIPAGALVMPPGTPAAPPPEAAMPGGPQDPSQQAGAQPGGGDSAIAPVEPIQGASPELAGGGAAKAAQHMGEPYSGGGPRRSLPSVQTRASAVAAMLRRRTAQPG